MEICFKWIALGILFLHVTQSFGYYPEYVIEQYCQRGNENIFYNISKVGASGRIIPSSSLPYQPNKNCTVVILTPPDVGIVLSVRKIDFRQPGVFCLDYIKIYHSDIRFSPTTLCRFKFDLREKESYYAKELIQFVYHVGSEISEGTGMEVGFDLTFTLVTEDQERCSNEKFFQCDNGRCIPYGLTCDTRNNCGDNSDEASVLCDPVPKFNIWNFDGIMYGILTCAILCSIGLTCLFTVTKTRRNLEQARPPRLSPYNAVHPSGYVFSQNPAGAQAPYLGNSKIESEEFPNSGFHSGVPPPPYHE